MEKLPVARLEASLQIQRRIEDCQELFSDRRINFFGEGIAKKTRKKDKPASTKIEKLDWEMFEDGKIPKSKVKYSNVDTGIFKGPVSVLSGANRSRRQFDCLVAIMEHFLNRTQGFCPSYRFERLDNGTFQFIDIRELLRVGPVCFEHNFGHGSYNKFIEDILAAIFPSSCLNAQFKQWINKKLVFNLFREDRKVKHLASAATNGCQRLPGYYDIEGKIFSDSSTRSQSQHIGRNTFRQYERALIAISPEVKNIVIKSSVKTNFGQSLQEITEDFRADFSSEILQERCNNW